MKASQQEMAEKVSVEIIKTWKADPAIRAEFRTISTYAAYMQAGQLGNIRVCGSETHK